MRSVLLLMMGVLLALESRSQLCTGSLGDPVAHISFGAGSSQGPPLPSGKTNYNYVSGSCPDDGQYTLTNLTFGCFSGTWHTVVGDHTPDDAGGFYMLVNASREPGIFYTDTVHSLCGGTTYEFSAFVMNVIKNPACENQAIRPDLTFTIETLSGQKLVTYNTGSIRDNAAPTWVQYGTFLTTPSGVSSVIIKITNNAPGGCGNDLALDDIMFRPCGPKVQTGIGEILANDTAFCEPDTRVFTLRTVFTQGFQDTRLQWQVSYDEGFNWQNIPGATSATYTRQPTNRGVYKYRVLIGDGDNINLSACRIASNSVTIRVTPPAFVQATNYVDGCLGSKVPLFASGASKFSWTGPNGFTSDKQDPVLASVQYRDSGMYIVKGTTNTGCVGYDTTVLYVFENVRITYTSPVSVCEGEAVRLTASGGTKIKWDPSAGLDNDTIYSPTATVNQSTSYKVTVLNRYGCFDTGTVFINVLKLPKADAGPDLRMLRGKPIQLRSTISGTDVSHFWSPVTYMEDPSAVRPFVNPPSDSRYRLTVISNRGCGSQTDEMEVKVLETIKVPNTFTPNGDGYNDVWEIELLNLFESCILEVYNTAGQLVHRNIGYSRPWDGTRNGNPLPAGTYYYAIDLRLPGYDKLAGYITIIR